jgi:hypothetical protein
MSYSSPPALHKPEPSSEKKRKKHYKPHRDEGHSAVTAPKPTGWSPVATGDPSQDFAQLLSVRTVLWLSGRGKLEDKDGGGKVFTIIGHDCYGYKYVIQGWDCNAITLHELFEYVIACSPL